MLKKSLIFIMCALISCVFSTEDDDKKISSIINHFSLPRNENKITNDTCQNKMENFSVIPNQAYQIIFVKEKAGRGSLRFFKKTKDHVEKTASIAIDYFIYPNQFEAVKDMALLMSQSTLPFELLLGSYKKIDLGLGEICLIDTDFNERDKKLSRSYGRCFFIRNGVLLSVLIINQDIEFWPILKSIDEIIKDKTTE